MLELSNQEFKTTMIILLRALIEEGDNTQEYMIYVSRQTLRRKSTGNARNEKH